MPEPRVTKGVHHVGLTVPDIEETAAFFVETLGFERVGGRPAYPSIFVSDGTTMISLWQASDPATARAFERKNTIGLHHFAFLLDPEELDPMHERLAAAGVEVAFAPELVRDGPTRHMMCVIPGGIRLEFIAPQTG